VAREPELECGKIEAEDDAEKIEQPPVQGITVRGTSRSLHLLVSGSKCFNRPITRNSNAVTAISPFGREETGVHVSSRKYPKLGEILVLEDVDFAALLDAEGAIACVPLSQPEGLKRDALVDVEGRTQKLATYQGRTYRVIARILDVIPGKRPVRPTVSLRFALFDSVNPQSGSTEMVA